MPENKNQNINPNPSTSSQNIASSSGTSNPTKGKGKEVINVVEELDLIIQNTEQLSVNVTSESKANLNTTINNNQLFWMKPNEREKQVEKFSGLDRILYDRLEKKVGKRQETMAENIVSGSALGLLGLVPVLSTVITVPVLLRVIDERSQEIERSFSVDEVKEIINELGITNKNNNTATLKKIKRAVMDRDQGLSTRISELEATINRYEQKEQEIRNRAVDKIKKGRTLDSKAITELRQAKDRINELENEILELEQNRDDFKDLLDAQEIKTEAKQRELQNAINAAETLNTRLETAEDEAINHKNRADIAEGVIKLRDQRIRTLEAEKEAAAPSFLKKNWNYFKTETTLGKWGCETVAGVNRLIWITGALVVLFVLSFVYKYLIRPMIKNFKGEPKPKEPQSTPTATINHNQPPIIIIPPQHQAPPTNHYQPLPSQQPEIKAIEVEPAKPPKNSKISKKTKKKPTKPKNKK